MTIKNFVLLTLFAVACSRESNDIPYPTPLPEKDPQVFLKGVVSRGPDSLDFNAAFSPDGKRFLFSRSAQRKYTIMESRYGNNEWAPAIVSPMFDTLYSNTDPFFAPDGSLYFISNRPKDSADSTNDFDIYRMMRNGEDWQQPEHLSINTDSTEYYVSVSKSGNIYFASYRDGNLDLYMSAKNADTFGEPVALTTLNSVADEHDPLIAPDESYIIFCSTRDGGFGEADLYIARHANGTWQTPINMGPSINTKTYEYCPNLSPDGRYFFYSSEYDVKWVSSAIVNNY